MDINIKNVKDEVKLVLSEFPFEFEEFDNVITVKWTNVNEVVSYLHNLLSYPWPVVRLLMDVSQYGTSVILSFKEE